MNTTFAKQINIYTTDKYWSQVVAILKNILKLERFIILECKLGPNYAKEIAALNCSLKDVNEQFYKQNLTQEIITYNFLQPTNNKEEQLLIPIWFENRLQGVLLLGIKNMQPEFIKTAKYFTNQIGEAIYHRQQLLNNTKVEVCKTSLERQLAMLENIIDDSETATVLYDVFGLAVQVNQSMRALAQIFELKPQTMTALDFYVLITKIDAETAKQNFYNMLLQQNKIVQQIKLSGVVERYFILNIQVFHYFDEDLNKDMQQGILCQLVDVTKMKLQSTLKEQIAERLIFQFRNDMQSILSASQLLTSQQTNVTEKHTAADILQKKINSHLKILTQVEKQLKIQMNDDPTNVTVYLLDAKESILDAIENASAEAEKRQVKIIANLPDLVSLIFASRTELYWVVGSILALLIEDAVPETNIVIDMEERDHWVTYIFKNTGFGIPDERLQEYLLVKELEVTEKFHDVRRAINIAKIWDGTLIAKGQVGVGITFELRLRSFI